MAVRLRANATFLVGATAGVLGVAYLTLRSTNWNDYLTEARPAFDALVHGHLHRFVALAPGYGGSLVLRAPFVLLAHAFGADENWIFRASAIPCLAAAALLGVWLAAAARRRGAGRLAQWTVLMLCAFNPLTVQAVKWGHPEEVLGAALAVGAVLAAERNRPLWAGALLGLAIGNKEWAVLAIGPVLVAVPARRRLTAGTALLVAGALYAPFLLGGSAGGGLLRSGVASTGTVFQRWQLWWFFGVPRPALPASAGPVMISARTAPAWISSIMHPLIAALGLQVSAGYAWMRRRSPRSAAKSDGLLLLALLMLLRCILDPWDFTYYPLPFLLALCAWEALRLGAVPRLSMAATVAAWLLMYETAMPIFGIPQDVQSLLFLAVFVPAAAAAAVSLFRPQRRPHGALVPAAPSGDPVGAVA